MGRWYVAGLDGPLFCYPKAYQHARRVAQAQSSPVMVTYHGHRDNPNRNPAASNFITLPDGTKDFKVDPTWWENHK